MGRPARDLPVLVALLNCLTDEAAARPETVRAALSECVRLATDLSAMTEPFGLCNGRYGADFETQAEAAFTLGEPFASAANALSLAVWARHGSDGEASPIASAHTFGAMLRSDVMLTRAKGALCIVNLCHRMHSNRSESFEGLEAVLADYVPEIAAMLDSNLEQERGVAAWAYVWLGTLKAAPANPATLARLLTVSRTATSDEVARLANWAFVSQPSVAREQFATEPTVDAHELKAVAEEYFESKSEYAGAVALILAWYLETWSKPLMVQRATALTRFDRSLSANSIIGALASTTRRLRPPISLSGLERTLPFPTE